MGPLYPDNADMQEGLILPPCLSHLKFSEASQIIQAPFPRFSPTFSWKVWRATCLQEMDSLLLQFHKV